MKSKTKRALSQIFWKFHYLNYFFRYYGNIDQILLCGIIFSKNKVLDLEILSLTPFCFRRITEKLSFRSFCFHKTVLGSMVLTSFCMQKDGKTITKNSLIHSRDKKTHFVTFFNYKGRCHLVKNFLRIRNSNKMSMRDVTWLVDV